MQIEVKLKNPSKKLDHYGIKVEFIGQIQLFYDRANHHEFTSLVRLDLAPEGSTNPPSARPRPPSASQPCRSHTGSGAQSWGPSRTTW